MGEDTKESYIRALKRQALEMASHPWSRSRKFHSLFIGGGTPSFMDTEKMAAFIRSCLAAFDFEGSADREPEVTLEANPNSVDAVMLGRFRQAGVNRLSMGIQSFSDTLLKNIGRIHTVREGIKAYELGRAAGFTSINLDLMYGLPGQRVEDWESSLRQALVLCPDHVSAYELTIKP